MSEPAQKLPPAAPTPLAADLTTRILELAIAWARAHDARNIKDEHEIAAYLRATIREVAPHLGPVQFETADRVRETVNADGAAYEIYRDDQLVAVRLYDVTGDDALVHFTVEQAGRFRIDLTRVLLGGAK